MLEDIVVIGAGVVGLSTAVNIQKCLPGARVKVVAEHFYERTTSYGSGGIFIPTSPLNEGPCVEKFRQWCGDSWKHFAGLATGPEAGICGAIISTGYQLCNGNLENYQNPLFREFVFEHERLTDKAMVDLGFKRLYKYGFKITTVIFDQKKYLLWLQQRFKENNGKFEKSRVTDLKEFVGKCDVLVNCSGFGSRDLLGDNHMFPARGQIVRVRVPWIKHWVYTDDITYMIPGEQTVALGGMKQIGNESLEVLNHETEDILRRCKRIIPSLEAAEIDHSWVGLRPCRDSIRLEKETLRFSNGMLQIVHNYGHGADGVALSWGTSLEAADLVKKTVQNRREVTSKL